MLNDSATFGGNARVSMSGATSGQQEFQDHGPMQALRFKALMVQAVICSEDESVMSAEIYGIGSVDGQGEFEYQIKLEDQGEPGTDDKYGSSSRASHITRATSNSREETSRSAEPSRPESKGRKP